MSGDRSSQLSHNYLHQRLRGRTDSKDSSVDTAYPSSLSSSHTWNITSTEPFAPPALAGEDSSLSSTEGQFPRGIEIDVVPTQPNDQVSLNRRRSHRPRGCRGGRKNRKKQLAKSLGVLMPKEILGAKTDSNFLSKIDAHKLASWGSMARSEDGPLGSALANPDENSTFWRRLETPYQPSLGGQGAAGELLYDFSRPRDFLNGSSRTEGASDETSMKSRIAADSTLAAGTSKTFQEILPPPPVLSTKSRLDRVDGPNPYALSVSASMTNRSFMVGRMNQDDCQGQQTQAVNVNTLLAYDVGLSSKGYAVAEPDDSSGSLFATSPRSFLMGYHGASVGTGD